MDPCDLIEEIEEAEAIWRMEGLVAETVSEMNCWRRGWLLLDVGGLEGSTLPCSCFAFSFTRESLEVRRLRFVDVERLVDMTREEGDG